MVQVQSEIPNPKYQVVTLAKAEDRLASLPPVSAMLEPPSIICENLEESYTEPFPLKVQDKPLRSILVPILDLAGEGKKLPPTEVRAKPDPVPNKHLSGSQVEEVESPTFGEREESSPSQEISSRSLSPPRPVASLKSSETPDNLQPALGRSALLRPLIAKKDALLKKNPPNLPQARFPSEASTIKFNSSLSTAHKKGGNRPRWSQEIERVDLSGGKFRLNGYTVGGEVDCGEMQGTWYRGDKQGEGVLVCEYRKRELRKLMVRKRETGVDALREQVEVLAGVEHPNIVSLLEVLDDPGKDQMYIVLKLDYASSLLSLAPLDEASAWDVYQQMLGGVKYLHEELRAVHNELKPSSFLVDTSGTIKLCWVLSLSPLSSSNPGDDLFHLTAILFLLLFSKPEDGDDYFTELLEILRSER